MKRAEKARTFALFSQKGGVGRSCLCAGLAKALSAHGKTLLFDLDGCVHTCDILLGLEDEALFTLDDLLAGEDPGRVFRSPEDAPQLFLCPAPAGEGWTGVSDAAGRMFDAARQIGAEYILFDAPARTAASAFALKHVEEPLVVSCFDALSVLAAEITAQQIFDAGKTPRLLLNRFSPDEDRPYGACEIIDRTHARLLGVVPEKSVFGSEVFTGAFTRISQRLNGGERPLFDGLPDGKKLRKML